MPSTAYRGAARFTDEDEGREPRIPFFNDPQESHHNRLVERRSLEHAVLYRRRLRETGCLHPAPARSWLALLIESKPKVQVPPAESSQRLGLMAALEAACSEASVLNWDGYGALPVNARSRKQAEAFIVSLSKLRSLPEIAVDPDGAVRFDWLYSTDRVLSVSLDRDGMLCYAAMKGKDRSKGAIEYNAGPTPRLVADMLDWIA